MIDLLPSQRRELQRFLNSSVGHTVLQGLKSLEGQWALALASVDLSTQMGVAQGLKQQGRIEALQTVSEFLLASVLNQEDDANG